MKAPIRAWLETINGDQLPLRDSCGIGRAPENRVVVAGEKVSRRHALVHRQNESEFWLVDLGSRNGTYRNGSRLRQPTQLRDRDRVDIGSVQLTFRVEQTNASQLPTEATPLAETIVTQRRSQVWLLVVDVENFTGISQSLAPDELAQRLGSWLLQCSDIVESTAGSVDKYVGDGFLAYWDSKVGAQNFIAALNNFTQLQKAGSLKFRWTVHYASLQLGISQFGNDSLVGKEVNFAYRMEKIAGTLRLERLLSEPAAKSLRGSLPSRPVGAHPVKGFEGHFEFFTV